MERSRKTPIKLPQSPSSPPRPAKGREEATDPHIRRRLLGVLSRGLATDELQPKDHHEPGRRSSVKSQQAPRQCTRWQPRASPPQTPSRVPDQTPPATKAGKGRRGDAARSQAEVPCLIRGDLRGDAVAQHSDHRSRGRPSHANAKHWIRPKNQAPLRKTSAKTPGTCS
jgi:hypothetical protein